MWPLTSWSSYSNLNMHIEREGFLSWGGWKWKIRRDSSICPWCYVAFKIECQKRTHKIIVPFCLHSFSVDVPVAINEDSDSRVKHMPGDVLPEPSNLQGLQLWQNSPARLPWWHLSPAAPPGCNGEQQPPRNPTEPGDAGLNLLDSSKGAAY